MHTALVVYNADAHPQTYSYPTADLSSPEFAAQLQQFAILPHRQDIVHNTFFCDGSAW